MKSYHTLIVGPSDGGKTTLMREVAEESPCPAVWVNFERRDGYDDTYPGVKAGSVSEAHEAVGSFDSWENVAIDLRMSGPEDTANAALDFALDVWDTAGVPVTVLSDEAHNVMPDGSDESNPGRWALAEGRDKGVKFVMCTQNPQKLEYADLMNVRYWVWVGEYVSAMNGFIHHWQIDKEALPSDRFEYTVLNRSMDTLYKGTTREEYAG